ncbi:MAG TPA: xanthine dehydrogenase family protein molybdopterin-binding subunit [Gaiellaceae bacterium]|nr:xanthine dehydrogenase family protein molybdopterin-binding subunit [Gaiellaceae bacterium]
MSVAERTLIGAPVDRLEGREKVTGAAKYAYEYEAANVVHVVGVAATVPSGRVVRVDAESALKLPGVVAVLWHATAPRLAGDTDPELAIMQSDRVSYRGQWIAAVAAETYAAASAAGRALRIDYEEAEHDSVLTADHPALYTPETVNPGFPSETSQGDVDAALAQADVVVDETYRTPTEHNNAMEPHATLAVWDGDDTLTVYDSNQGVRPVRQALASAFSLDPENVRVISPHVGGGFGSKGTPRPNVILAAMAAKVVGRPAKVAVTRQQMFSVTGYRTPTIQRVRLGATRDGRLTAIAHDVVEQTSMLKEFAEQTAVVTRMLYAAPNRRTSHKLARLNVPTPSWMRAPGECPGAYALESAMDELARALDIDPIELRIRNEPELDPESGNRFSTRNLVGCLREGAERFGWKEPPSRDGRWLVGTGVAASTYPARRQPSQAIARADADGSFTIGIAAADIGTGARTVIAQIAADTLEVELERVHVELGDSRLPPAMIAGGSMGTSSWGAAVVKACRGLRPRLGGELPVEVFADTEEDAGGVEREPVSSHGFGAQFVEVGVDSDTGEVRVSRVLGVFACGRIMNAKTARSQFIGGITMGLGMALLEETLLDGRFGAFVNHDLAGYHVAVNADVPAIEVHWLDEFDEHVNPMGAKGIGEIGIVGTAAAVANAIHDATGIRVRELPITPAKLASLI